MTTILNETKIIFSKRQPKNLKQFLTKAAFTNVENTPHHTVKKCGKSCKTCLILDTGETILFNCAQEEFCTF